MRVDWVCPEQTKQNNARYKTCTQIDFDYIEQICWNTKTNTEQCKAQNMHRDWVCPEQVHYSCMICCCLLFQSPFKQPPPFLHICLPLCFFFVSFWHGVDKIWISNNLFSFWKKRQASILYCRFKNQISIKF